MSYKSKYRGLRINKSLNVIDQVPFKYSQCDFLRVSARLISIPLENNNIGLYPLEFKGLVDDKTPKIFHAHMKRILDLQFSPFDFRLLASCSMDGLTKIWSVPDPFEKDIKEPKVVLNCEKKVCCLKFHPTCPSLLASGAVTKKLQIWDLEKGEEKVCLSADVPLSMEFNPTGEVLYSCGRNKKLMMLDVRSENPVVGTTDCQGSKGINVLFCEDKNFIITTGFERNGRRGFRVYDHKKLDNPIQKVEMRDQSSGVVVSFYDSDLGILYCCGRGESSIVYYDMETGIFREIGTHLEREPHLGIYPAPKVALNTMKNEIGRFYKFTPKKTLYGVECIMSKMSTDFQEDLFPDTKGFIPTCTSEEFFKGEEIKPCEKISLNPSKREENTLFCEQKK